MKCFTLRPQVQVVMGGSPHGMGAHSFTERYPTAKAGFPLNDNRVVSLAWDVQVPSSPELLRVPDPNAIKREGRDMSVLRASVSNGMLVPERADDKENALVLLAVGSTPGLYLTFDAGDAEVVGRGVDDDGRWGRTEEMLVVLKPFQRVTATRRDRKWFFWGEVRVVERLSIYFDGRTICYDVDPPRRTGSAW